MFVCVRVYVCVFVCACARVCARAYVCVSTYMFMSVQVCVPVLECVRVPVHCVCVCISMCSRMCKCICKHTHIQSSDIYRFRRSTALSVQLLQALRHRLWKLTSPRLHYKNMLYPCDVLRLSGKKLTTVSTLYWAPTRTQLLKSPPAIRHVQSLVEVSALGPPFGQASAFGIGAVLVSKRFRHCNPARHLALSQQYRSRSV